MSKNQKRKGCDRNSEGAAEGAFPVIDLGSVVAAKRKTCRYLLLSVEKVAVCIIY
jgi:hypothetical protein